MLKKINELVKKNHEAVVALRRHFHTHPELSTQEFNTQKKIIDELTKLGLTPQVKGGTGVVADIVGAKPGKTIAIRADIDALAVPDECGKSYQSQNPGVCHACGHDAHTATLIGVAKVMTELKDEINGTIRLLFQPSEEMLPGGALALIKDGALEGVDAIIGAHIWQNVPVGKVGLTFGKLMAATNSFGITVKGRGGHGSQPQETNDPLLTGAQLAVALNTIVSRNISALDSAVLSIGSLKSGEAFNVIPSIATIKGNVRSFTPEVKNKIFSRIEEITKGICASAGADYEFDAVGGLPPVINNAEIAKVIFDSAEEVLGKGNALELQPVLGSEDFAYYLEKVPGAFVFVGSGNPEKGITYPHHHSKFDIDEDSLANSVAIMTLTAFKLLK